MGGGYGGVGVGVSVGVGEYGCRGCGVGVGVGHVDVEAAGWGGGWRYGRVGRVWSVWCMWGEVYAYGGCRDAYGGVQGSACGWWLAAGGCAHCWEMLAAAPRPQSLVPAVAAVVWTQA